MRNSNRFRQLLGLALVPVFLIAARPVGPSDADKITLTWIQQAFDHETEFDFETRFDGDGRLSIITPDLESLTVRVELREDERSIRFFTERASNPFAPGTSSEKKSDLVDRLNATVPEVSFSLTEKGNLHAAYGVSYEAVSSEAAVVLHYAYFVLTVMGGIKADGEPHVAQNQRRGAPQEELRHMIPADGEAPRARAGAYVRVTKYDDSTQDRLEALARQLEGLPPEGL